MVKEYLGRMKKKPKMCNRRHIKRAHAEKEMVPRRGKVFEKGKKEHCDGLYKLME